MGQVTLYGVLSPHSERLQIQGKAGSSPSAPSACFQSACPAGRKIALHRWRPSSDLDRWPALRENRMTVDKPSMAIRETKMPLRFQGQPWEPF